MDPPLFNLAFQQVPHIPHRRGQELLRQTVSSAVGLTEKNDGMANLTLLPRDVTVTGRDKSRVLAHEMT